MKLKKVFSNCIPREWYSA